MLTEKQSKLDESKLEENVNDEDETTQARGFRREKSA